MTVLFHIPFVNAQHKHPPDCLAPVACLYGCGQSRLCQKAIELSQPCFLWHPTGIHKAHVSRAMSNLVSRKILTREGKMVGLQKDYEAWLELPELVTKVTQTGNNLTPEKLPVSQQKLPERQPKLPKMVKKVTSPRVTQKKKETIQKKLYKRNSYPHTTEPVDPDKFIKGRYGHVVHR